jgi:transposase-like protein
MDVTGSKDAAVNLRLTERLSVKDIATRLGIAKSTASLWVRDYPLSPQERQARQSQNGKERGGWNKKDRGEESKFHSMVADATLSNDRKDRIAESAVLFRLALLGFSIHSPVFDGDHIDWLVGNPKTHKLSRLQVRSVHDSGTGLPNISLQCFLGHSGKRKYTSNECDVIVGYDLFTDIAYVFDYASQTNKTWVTITDEAAERWDLIP